MSNLLESNSFIMSMKIINKKICNRNRKEFYLSHSEDYSLEDSLSDNSEDPLQRSMVFSTDFFVFVVFCFLFCLFVCLFCLFLGPHLQHMEVPRLGV